MTTARVLSIQVARPKLAEYKGKPVETAFFKQPVAGPVFLGKTNLTGDQQANLEFHGGPDKAVCVYPVEHYPYWEKVFGKELTPGAFGENLTVQGMLEDDLCIGDTFALGEAVVQITEARIPCFKIAMAHGVDKVGLQVMQTGFTGFYLRVLQEGHVEAGQELRLLERHPLGVTVAFTNHARFLEKNNVESIKRILAVPELSQAWREGLEKQLAELEKKANEA
ncbi:MOSC domain-containing protein [Tumebacillus sp. DT12]|uniref:MOSC domain-containing protein n=1 Tax=Tumebacillus lacus TaxID=2995335 RepID=A0ABT3WXF2_9BACL|nr:MOSC domain-containing protein [Tumebacillus lacus]MCX7569334.1 MOSC domain-containing protein [Tumebacillus lacus]